jgi:hypothetical protein
MNVVLVVRVSIVDDPLTGFVPLQPPLATQLSAFSVFHITLVPPPSAT